MPIQTKQSVRSESKSGSIAAAKNKAVAVSNVAIPCQRISSLISRQVRIVACTMLAVMLAACDSADDDRDNNDFANIVRPTNFIEPNSSPGVTGAFQRPPSNADDDDMDAAGIGGVSDGGGDGNDAVPDAGGDGNDGVTDTSGDGDDGVPDAGGDGDDGVPDAGGDGNGGVPDAGGDGNGGVTDAGGTDEPVLTIVVGQPISSVSVGESPVDLVFDPDTSSFNASVPFLVSSVPVSINGGPVIDVPLEPGNNLVSIETLSNGDVTALNIDRASVESLLPPQFLKDGSSMLESNFGQAVAVDEDLLAILGRDTEQRLNIFRLQGDIWQLEQVVELSGQSISIDEQRIAVGDIDGGGRNIPGFGNGTVAILERFNNSWNVVAELTAENPGVADQFGHAVALVGDTLLVGAPGEDSSATGINGDATLNDAFDSGAAYLFVRQNDQWVQNTYFKGDSTAGGDQFGFSVAARDGLLVVGAPGEASSATGVNGDPQDNSLVDSGAAFIFERGNSGLSQVAYLKASNTGVGDAFGTAVDLTDTTVVVGAPDEDSGFSGNPSVLESDDSLNNAGAVYTFIDNGTAWVQSAYLKSSSPDNLDRFGNDLAIESNTLVIAAPSEDGSNTVISETVFDNSTNNGGAVFIFQNMTVAESNNMGVWSQELVVRGTSPDAGDRFGSSVSLGDGTLAVGVPGESSNPQPVANPADDSLAGAGAVFVFR